MWGGIIFAFAIASIFGIPTYLMFISPWPIAPPAYKTFRYSAKVDPDGWVRSSRDSPDWLYRNKISFDGCSVEPKLNGYKIGLWYGWRIRSALAKIEAARHLDLINKNVMEES